MVGKGSRAAYLAAEFSTDEDFRRRVRKLAEMTSSAEYPPGGSRRPANSRVFLLADLAIHEVDAGDPMRAAMPRSCVTATTVLPRSRTKPVENCGIPAPNSACRGFLSAVGQISGGSFGPAPVRPHALALAPRADPAACRDDRRGRARTATRSPGPASRRGRGGRACASGFQRSHAR